MTDHKRPNDSNYEEESEGVVTMGDYGANATTNLQPLQSAILTGDEGAIKAALNQVLDDEETVLMERVLVLVSEKKEEEAEEEVDKNQESDEDNEANDGSNDKANNGEESAVPAGSDPKLTPVPMSLIVTSERCLFIASSTESNASSKKAAEASNASKPLDSFWVDGESIQLHAQSADPISIYLQVEGDTEESSPTEITIIPNVIDNSSNNPQADDDDNKIEKVCEKLFSTLTKLIELHPIQEDNGGDPSGGMMGMMSMMAMMAGNQEPSNRIEESITGGPSSREATPEERAAMLEKLDDMLVVKPGLEIVAGQFSDAEDEDNNEDDAIVGKTRKEIMPKESMGTSSEAAAAPPKPAGGKGQFDDADDDDIENDPLL